MVTIAKFEQINSSWARETIVSETKFVFSNCEKYIVLLPGNICWSTSFHPYSVNRG